MTRDHEIRELPAELEEPDLVVGDLGTANRILRKFRRVVKKVS